MCSREHWTEIECSPAASELNDKAESVGLFCRLFCRWRRYGLLRRLSGWSQVRILPPVPPCVDDLTMVGGSGAGVAQWIEHLTSWIAGSPAKHHEVDAL